MTTAVVIGCGDVSIVHFGALASLPEVQLVAVGDTNTERLMAAVEDYHVPGYANHVALLKKVRPDVCTSARHTTSTRRSRWITWSSAYT
jgi:UDP-N-acetyl-2-amino-2-deoxyglucuronate dehydrogenase